MTITLTTDFGLKDSYVGTMKGAILSINPKADIIDISHMVSQGNVIEGAYIMHSACSYFPDKTIHVGVVDPGVGTPRSPILIETDRFYFIGPDNGLLTLAARDSKVRRVIKLIAKKYFNMPVSRTFHGRDVFAPVAAHLSAGVMPTEFGPLLKSGPKLINMPRHSSKGGIIRGVIIHADSYGNLISNIPSGAIRNANVCIEIAGRRITGLKPTYGGARRNELIALIGSADLLEIAVNMGSAADTIKAGRGDAITIKPLK